MSFWDKLTSDLIVMENQLSQRHAELEQRRVEIEKNLTEMQAAVKSATGQAKDTMYERWREWVKEEEKVKGELLEIEDGVVLAKLIEALVKKNSQEFTKVLLSSPYAYLIENKLVQALEEEKKRLSRELHDGPVQSVAASILRMQIAQGLAKKGEHMLDKVLEELTAAMKLSEKGVDDLRGVIFNLRPMTLDDLGLFAALRRYVENFQNTNKIAVELVLDQEVDLDREVKNNLFRLLQEAFVNVQKHARAKKVVCKIEYDGRYLIGFVQDDGQGFDLSAIKEKESHHFGLIGMQERAKLLGGRVEIHTEVGNGTKITFLIPVMTLAGAEKPA